MFGLYLHIPFCQHKCNYCDFYSIERVDQIDDFVQLLLREIRLRAIEWGKSTPPVSSVFMGGGTPSLLSPTQLDAILHELHRAFRFEDECEWSMECNPGTVSKESLVAYRKSGINRLSFGVQSFHQDELTFLERIHDPMQAVEAVEYARAAGFDNVNIDLMFALPGQTADRYRETLRRALELQTEHISAYSLIFEEGTPLYKQLLAKEVQPQSEDVDLHMYELTMETLSAHGYQQYEVSNFARPGRQCRHNVCYWRGDEYLAFGPSAHGYFRSTRYWNVKNLGRYVDSLRNGALPTLNAETLSKTDQMFERAFLELRSGGIDIERFRHDFLFDIVPALGSTLEWLKEEGYVTSNQRVSLTHKGYAQCDEITLKVIQLLEQAAHTRWQRAEPAEETETAFPLSVIQVEAN